MSRRAWTILLATVVLMLATAIALQPSPFSLIKACLRSEAWPSSLFHLTNFADGKSRRGGYDDEDHRDRRAASRDCGADP